MGTDYSLNIHSKFLDYSVKFPSQLNFNGATLCIVDSNVMLSHSIPSNTTVISLKVSEENKNLDAIAEIIKILQDHHV